jgi:hypothetical protein
VLIAAFDAAISPVPTFIIVSLAIFSVSDAHHFRKKDRIGLAADPVRNYQKTLSIFAAPR